MKTKLIGILLLAVVVSEIILINLWRQSHVGYWNGVACETFKEALCEDLMNRDDLKIEYYGKNVLASVGSKVPQSVFVISKYGRREYKIDSCKHVNNVVPDSRMRQLYSIVLEKYPIQSDTLNARWRYCLDRKNIVARTGVRVSVINLDNHTKSELSTPFETEYVKDSLLSCYAGYRCEVEVTGFVNFAWLKNMDLKDYLLFSIPLAIAALLYIVVNMFMDKIKKLFIKEIPVVIEKEISVVVKENPRANIYKLAGGIRFDVNASALIKGDTSVHLTPQTKTLLKAFLDAEECRLTVNEIMSVLWPKGNGTSDKMHQSVTRLRNRLAQIPGMTIINDDCAYQLKMPHSIEE